MAAEPLLRAGTNYRCAPHAATLNCCAFRPELLRCNIEGHRCYGAHSETAGGLLALQVFHVVIDALVGNDLFFLIKYRGLNQMRIRMTPLLLVSSLALASTAIAAETPAPAEETVYFHGVKVAIDPKTGKLRQPTPAEMRQLRMVVPKASGVSIGKPMPKTMAEANRTYRRAPNGAVSLELPESSMSNVAAVQNADGSITIKHTDAVGTLPQQSNVEAVRE